ncbi:Bgt-51529, partial [Blumeria graminis f. sp. tritici]
ATQQNIKALASSLAGQQYWTIQGQHM